MTKTSEVQPNYGDTVVIEAPKGNEDDLPGRVRITYWADGELEIEVWAEKDMVLNKIDFNDRSAQFIIVPRFT
jgi:signal peptidase I